MQCIEVAVSIKIRAGNLLKMLNSMH